MNTISRFRGDFRFLSNFSDSPFEYKGFKYPTVEHAYQEYKTLDIDRRNLIRIASTPMEAAKFGRSKDTILVDNWEE